MFVKIQRNGGLCPRRVRSCISPLHVLGLRAFCPSVTVRLLVVVCPFFCGFFSAGPYGEFSFGPLQVEERRTSTKTPQIPFQIGFIPKRPHVPREFAPAAPDPKFPWCEKIPLQNFFGRTLYGASAMSKVLGRSGTNHKKMEQESGAKVLFRGRF